MSDYGKLTIPATGATGFAAMAFTDQLAIVLGIGVGVFLVATALRVLFRRGKSINQA